MYALIKPFVDLLLFRAEAKDIPASQSLLKYAIIVSFISDALGASKTLGLPMSMLLTAGQIALLAGFIFILLKLHQKPERYLQAITAVFGTLALINIASLPFVQNLRGIDPSQLVITPGLLIIALLQVWFFITMVRILRNALEISTGRSILLTFLIINAIPLLLSAFLGAIGYMPDLPAPINN